MQILTIAGNVGKDPELRTTQSGDNVLGFSVAVDQGKDSQGNKRPAAWYDCSLWGKRATALQPYIAKGMKVTISGRPTCRAHDGKAYMGVSINEITLQGGGNANQQHGNSSGSTNQSYGSAPVDDTEIPF